MNSSCNKATSAFSRKLVITAATGAAILGATAVVSPDRAWANLLLATFFLITLGLGGALFIALANVSGGCWNAGFRRVPEAMTGLLPVAGLLLLATLAIRLPQYGWHHHGEGDPGTFWFKEFWLTPTFLAVRSVVYVALWTGLSRLMVGNSRRQDALPDVAKTRTNTRVSVLFLVVFAITISLAGVDWIMALEPMWFSTMWGVYQFAGVVQSTLAVIIIACVSLRRRGLLGGGFTDEHLHDLGKLLLGFSCFWMYIWFSQYMLIWYSNIPEETAYFIPRLHGPWGPVVAGTLALNWIIPFFVLLPRSSKRSETVMLRVAVVVLAGRWVDLAVMIFPILTGATPLFGLPEIASMLLLGGLTGWLFVRAFFAAAPVPVNDPCLGESLHYHA